MAEVFGYEFCTKVQAQSLPPCLSGTDVIAKAKTGTGKTLVGEEFNCVCLSVHPNIRSSDST